MVVLAKQSGAVRQGILGVLGGEHRRGQEKPENKVVPLNKPTGRKTTEKVTFSQQYGYFDDQGFMYWSRVGRARKNVFPIYLNLTDRVTFEAAEWVVGTDNIDRVVLRKTGNGKEITVNEVNYPQICLEREQKLTVLEDYIIQEGKLVEYQGSIWITVKLIDKWWLSRTGEAERIIFSEKVQREVEKWWWE